MILGLDVSTSCIGYSLIDSETGKLIDCDHIDLKKFDNLFDKADHCKIIFGGIKEKYNISKIAIEAALIGFNKNQSSPYTIAILCKFNGIVSYLAYQIFNVVPQFIECRSARTKMGITIPRKTDPKLTVIDFLKKNIPDFIPYIVYTKNGTYKPYVGDRADSLVIAHSILEFR